MSINNMQLSEIHSENIEKISDKWEIYLHEYNDIFQKYRNKTINYLEIGVQNGGFLEVISRYFPLAKRVIGVDVNEKVGLLKYTDSRVSVIVGDCNSLETLGRVKEAFNDFIDILVDDGSHTSEDIIKSFLLYFPLIVDKGIYIVEDIHCSYWNEFGGGLYAPYSSISFFKALVDIVNYEHWGLERGRSELLQKFASHYSIEIPDGMLASIHSIKFVNSLCIIERNTERSNTLGSRMIAGEAQEVMPIAHLANTMSNPLDQRNNSWSNYENSQVGAVEYKNYLIKEMRNLIVLKDQLTDENEIVRGEKNALQAKVVDFSQRLLEAGKVQASSQNKNEKLTEEIENLGSKLFQFEQQIELLRSEKNKYAIKCDALTKQLNAFQKSLTWRATAPIRSILELVGAGRKQNDKNSGGSLHSVVNSSKSNVISGKGSKAVQVTTGHPVSRTLFNVTNASALNSVSKYVPPAHQIEISTIEGISQPVGPKMKLGIFLHAFHAEMVPEFLRLLSVVGYELNIYVTTDTIDKAGEIESAFNAVGLPLVFLNIKVTPNRGRDIAPRFVWQKDEIKSVDLGLLIHTKKSPHIGDGASWRDYLWNSLIGSDQLLKNIISIFQNNHKLGVLSPAHWPNLLMHQPINWGYNFPEIQQLIREIGGDITADTPLDFPSGSMFWFRPEALAHLTSDAVTIESFQEEAGQVDGTFAHAIERSIFYVSELAGYFWLKYKPVVHANFEVYQTNLEHIHCRLLGNDQIESSMECRIPESAIPPTKPSSNERMRITLLIPTLQRVHIFGGITTAVSFFTSLLNKYIESEILDARIIVTDDFYSSDKKYLQISDLKINSNQMEIEILALSDILNKSQLSVRAHEIFISSAWWNAMQMQKIQSRIRQYFGAASKNIYLIQDYEPGFYAWSSKTAISDATYWRTKNEIKVVNDSFLEDFMRKSGVRADVVVPFGINDSIAKAIAEIGTDLSREKIIIFYGRPKVERNCFELIVDAIAKWACESPYEFDSWRIISLGELYSEDDLPPILVDKVEIIGKLALNEYATLLMRASIGISFMESPHPSYPPQEMRYAGMHVIVNNWRTKIWQNRSSDYIVVNSMGVSDVLKAIKKAVNYVNLKQYKIANNSTPLQSEVNNSVAEEVMRLLQ